MASVQLYNIKNQRLRFPLEGSIRPYLGNITFRAFETIPPDTNVIKGITKAARNTRNIRPFMDEYELFGGKKVYILGEGRLINLAAAEGHPSDVMSLSFCGQVLACEYLVQYKGSLQNKVYQLPEDIDVYISKLQLSALGKNIDELSKEQLEYLEGWEVGT